MARTISDPHEAQAYLKELFEDAGKAVFFGGAGVSTASGIKDFRSPDGLYNQKFDYPPEYLLSHSCYRDHPQEFFDFYRNLMIPQGVYPNQAHLKLAELEQDGKLEAVVTQNIDGLHQAAGSKTVYELHGSVHRNYCQKCNALYDAEYMLKTTGVPKCPKCGGPIKPDVVLYEEPLNNHIMQQSLMAIAQADTLIVGGTSLTVYPAAGLIDYFRGNNLVLINRDPTPRDGQADVLITCSIADAFDF